MLLSLLWSVPAIGCFLVWLMPSRVAARRAALLFSAALLAYAIWLMVPFAADSGTLRLNEIAGGEMLGIQYRLAVDGIGLALCWLTALLTLLAFAASPEDMPSGYWGAFLGLEAALFGVFTAQNLFYFYVFWDISLIPMFFIIGLWGSSRRRHASLKFILYTFLGSMSLLVGLVALVVLHHAATAIWTWDIQALARTPISAKASAFVFAAAAAGFAVKIPVVPLHNWLPDAHTEAPMAGSVLLAGSMLKMGVFGFLHILLPIFPTLARQTFPIFAALGAINVLYGALCAMVQTDLKRLVAYTSVSHLGFCVLGLFSLTAAGVAGGSLQMINHGLSTGGLFLLVGMLYERAHRRGLSDFGDLASTAPWFAFFFGVILLSSIGLPGLNGFVGEFMSLAGLARVSIPFAAVAALGTILAAAYGLPAYQKVFWAPAGPSSVSSKVEDLRVHERAVLWSLVALIVWLGVYPKPMLDLMTPAVAAVAVRH